ncbi:hypothetical protein BIV60_05900 [Bacillus sp. MUM 116]|nr:hypothetical protein BIV60_05900 [Bacillus sp. MUM 116]
MKTGSLLKIYIGVCRLPVNLDNSPVRDGRPPVNAAFSPIREGNPPVNKFKGKSEKSGSKNLI